METPRASLVIRDFELANLKPKTSLWEIAEIAEEIAEITDH
jgi:hypothetical protein